ncbi:hypothetical protein PCYB_051190 [Plasmodium cynomolgi strain B]|uniref:Fe2OG dioxygenase domain-containing protein n=1 Tax=Plasmodium cynomolgi (strain B) TaxID=1120755 RepID=K6UCM3_PLACD|nr:hypothetical protein PCYB_051190 [Plasmodium cynomolgi strain B]GAB65101.1 hypothetical protein PCYB_051190 [Plasmodium cynomolgi strain B]
MDLENTICNLVKIPLCYLEPLAIVKYEKNNYFNVHHDGTFRRATLLIYLNDVDEDGETIFPHYNLSIKPIQGSGIFWYNNIPVEEEYAITYCDKSNLEKFSIDIINDELGNMYIADMTMLHKANKVSDEYKYVINCFFNINIVRNV